LRLYIENDHNKAEKYAISLEKDPDLHRVLFDKTAEALMLIGIAKFNMETNTYSDCKHYLKKALGMTKNHKIISIIMHNLAIMNYFELSYHNEKVTGSENLDEKHKKMALAETISKSARHTEVDEQGSLKIK
jgi:hypothetical protein